MIINLTSGYFSFYSATGPQALTTHGRHTSTSAKVSPQLQWIISNPDEVRQCGRPSWAAAERLVAESLLAPSPTTHKTMLELRKAQSTKRLRAARGRRAPLGDRGWSSSSRPPKEQIDALVDFCARLDKAEDAYRELLHITQQCLVTRTRRRAIDFGAWHVREGTTEGGRGSSNSIYYNNQRAW